MLRHVLAQSKMDARGYLHDENQYSAIASHLLARGRLEEGRNGRVRADSGAAMHFSLDGGVMPIFTTKRVAWRSCLRELLWFVRGSTDAVALSESGSSIWDGNGSREFLDSQGLTGNREGDLGPVYGHQWRHFNAPYAGADSDYTGKGVDQLQSVVDALKDPERRTSRRIVMSAWNPAQINEMALPPCHLLAQFHVSEGKKLSCSLYQRSADMALGVPFNVASYAFLTHMLASHCSLEAHELVHHLGHCHVYEGHERGLEHQLKRSPRPFPRIRITERGQSRIEDYTENDFVIEGYNPHPRIQFQFRA